MKRRARARVLENIDSSTKRARARSNFPPARRPRRGRTSCRGANRETQSCAFYNQGLRCSEIEIQSLVLHSSGNLASFLRLVDFGDTLSRRIAGTRPVNHKKLVLSAGLTPALLQILIPDFSLKYALLMHGGDHLANGGGIPRKHREVKLRHCL